VDLGEGDEMFRYLLLLALVSCTAPPDDKTDETDTDTDTDNSAIPATISDIRQGIIALGTQVSVNGQVTAIDANGLFIQSSAGGPWSGIYIFLGPSPWSTAIAVGDLIAVTGGTDEFFGLSEIDSSPAAVTVTATGGTPVATVVTTANFADPLVAETYESVLVTVESVTVTDDSLMYGQWAIDDGVLIDDMFFVHPAVTNGDTFTSITGVGYFSYSEYKIEPRDAADFVGYTP